MAVNPGDAIKKRRLDGMCIDDIRDRLSIVNERDDGSVGEGATVILKDAFTTAHAGKPIVPEYDATVPDGFAEGQDIIV